jgi:hypothetical protein
MLLFFDLALADRRVLLLLEEIRSQNQTQILLLQQLLSTRTAQSEHFEVQDDLGLPLVSVQQLQKLDVDCQDRDIRAKLVIMSFTKFD